MTEFDTGLPSIRLLQQAIKEKQEVELKLLTDEVIVGTLLWQDAHCLLVVDRAEQRTLVWRQAIAYLKPKA